MRLLIAFASHSLEYPTQEAVGHDNFLFRLKILCYVSRVSQVHVM